jgi:hypothetical protein
VRDLKSIEAFSFTWLVVQHRKGSGEGTKANTQTYRDRSNRNIEKITQKEASKISPNNGE